MPSIATAYSQRESVQLVSIISQNLRHLCICQTSAMCKYLGLRSQSAVGM